MMPGKVDEISRAIGRIEEGTDSIKDDVRDLKETFDKASTSFSAALRTHSSEIGNIAIEVTALKNSDRANSRAIEELQQSRDTDRLRQAEHRGMMRVGKWALAGIMALASAFGAMLTEVFKYLWHHP